MPALSDLGARGMRVGALWKLGARQGRSAAVNCWLAPAFRFACTNQRQEHPCAWYPRVACHVGTHPAWNLHACPLSSSRMFQGGRGFAVLGTSGWGSPGFDNLLSLLSPLALSMRLESVTANGSVPQHLLGLPVAGCTGAHR